MGLSICKKLVDLLNGKIGVHSELNRGSEFWVELPLLNPTKQKYIQPKTLHFDHVIVLHSNEEYQNFLMDILIHMKLKKVLKNFDMENIIDSDEEYILFIEEKLMEDKMRDIGNIKIIIIGNDSELGSLKIPVKIDRFLRYLYPKTPLGSKPFSKYSIFDEKKVMVCEDNKMIHKSLLNLLKNSGITNITSAFNGEEAFNFFQEGMKFDIILMDIQMPKLNGIEATKKIRNFIREKMEKQPNIFICSGNAFDSDIQKLKEEFEVEEILVKPITKELLLTTMNKY